jgi:hypothetical protein
MITKKNLKPIIQTVVAQLSPKYGFDDIESSQTLHRLGLQHEATIAELKTSIYRAISGGRVKLDFNDFYKSVHVTNHSTFDQLLDGVFLALPGNDPTKPK